MVEDGEDERIPAGAAAVARSLAAAAEVLTDSEEDEEISSQD